MKRTLFLLATLSLAGAAYANDRPRASFDSLDRNNDGVISRAEYGKPARRSADPGFNVLDRNDDGYISRAESRRNGYLAERFGAADKNRDGRLNRAEYLAVMTKKDLALERRADRRSAATGGTASRQPSLP